MQGCTGGGLLTICTEFLASRLNVTINETNFMFEKKNKKKYEFGGLLKGSKRVLMGQKSYFFSQTNFLEYLRPERSPAARRCACLISIVWYACALHLHG